MGTEKKPFYRSRRATTDVASLSQADAYEEKIRRNVLAMGSRSRRASANCGEATHGSADDERLRLKLSPEQLSPEGAEEAFEERLRRKMSRGEKGEEGVGRKGSDADADAAFEERLKRKMAAGSDRQENRSSSLMDHGASAAEAAESHEEKVMRKLGTEGDRRSAWAGRRPDRLDMSMPASSAPTNFRINVESTNVAEHGASAAEAAETLSASSMASAGPRGSTRSSNEIEKEETKIEEEEAINQESLFDVPNVCFDVLFEKLQKFKQDNGSLAISVSHASFLDILDFLASVNMENLLKKRWDYQFIDVKAFKRTHGDCLIPPTHPSLRKWAGTQSNHYRRYEQRMPSPMTQKRFKKLKDIGFDEFVKSTESSESRAEVDSKASARGKATVIEAKDDPATFETVPFGEKLREKTRSVEEVAAAGDKDSKGVSDREPQMIKSRSATVGTRLALDKKLWMKKMESARPAEGEACDDSLAPDQKQKNPRKETSAEADDRASDQKFRTKKVLNNYKCYKYLERGMRVHASYEGEEQKKEQAAATLKIKRATRRNLQRGMSRRMLSKKLMDCSIQEVNNEEGSDADDPDRNNENEDKNSEGRGLRGGGLGGDGSVQQYGYMMRSSSASNLCIGSWECHKCSYINEPVGLNQSDLCKVCDTHKDERRDIGRAALSSMEMHTSMRMEDVFSSPSPPAAKTCDDINVGSWTQLNEPLALASSRSVRHLNTDDGVCVDSWSQLDGVLAMAVTKSIQCFDKRRTTREGWEG